MERPFLTADRETGEIVDRRDLEEHVRALFRPLPEALLRVNVGELTVRSKRITVVDRAVPHKQPFVREVMPGTWSVEVIRRRGEPHVAALLVRFSQDLPARIERAARGFPYGDERTFAFPSGVGAVFDYDAANRLSVPRQAELAALLSLEEHAKVFALERVRAWNGVAFRAPDDVVPHCSAFFALDSFGVAVALVVDCADIDLTRH